MDHTIELENIINSMDIKSVNPETKFWLIRTKKGFFYDEFIENKFVALGWNVLDSNILHEALEDEEKENDIKAELEYKYRKSKQGTQIFNKCLRFIDDINIGDIIMIPSAKSEEITFAIAGEYFEIDDLGFAKEIEVISQIDSKIDYGTEIKCPYKKRRHIEIIKSLDGKRLNPNLYKALASSHGISMINEYDKYILSSIYNLYCWENKLYVVFNVQQKKDIDAISLSSFIYNASSFINLMDKDIRVYAKANINSEGDVILALQNYANQAISILNSNKTLLGVMGVWFFIAGGKIGPLEFKSVVELYLNWKEKHSKLKDSEADRQLKAIQIQRERIKLSEEITKYSENIKESATNLKINQAPIENIINISDYFHQRNED